MSSRIGKIQVAYGNTGRILYAIVRNAIAEAWNVGGAAFEAFNVANWSQYAVPMTEQGALSKFYVADLPAGAENYYTATVYEQAGVGPAVADTMVEVIRAVQLADDVSHGGVPGGSTATLAARQLHLNNPSGICAILIGSAGAYIEATGPTASGLTILSDGTGNAVDIESVGGRALFMGSSGASPTVELNSTAGPTLVIRPIDGDAIVIVPSLGINTAAAGISIIGAGTGPAVSLGDGANGAEGLNIFAGAGSDAVRINTSGIGSGINIVGGAGSFGISLQCGSGINIVGQAGGFGLGIQSADPGFTGVIVSSDQFALFLVSTTGPAVQIVSGAEGVNVATGGGADAVIVNANTAIDNIGRQRIQSGLTNGDALLAFPFLMTDLAGNPKTGLTVTSTVILDGAAPVPTVNSPVEIGNGVYAIDLDASDRAGTTMMLRFTAPNARDLDIDIINTA